MSTLRRFCRDDSGAAVVEYGMIVALIVIVIVTSLTSIGTKLNGRFQTISNQFT